MEGMEGMQIEDMQIGDMQIGDIQVEDYVIGGTAAEGKLRFFLSNTTELVKKARELHNMSAIASVALGRTLTAAVLMSKTLKGQNDKITIQIKGNGPIGGIIATCDSNSNVKGYVHNPQVENCLNNEGKLDVANAVGKPGFLNVIKDLGLKEPYVGNVKLVSGEIAEDLSYYYYYSEQIPSIVSLGVLIGADESIINAGGFFIQVMPGADDEIITALENRICCLPPVTSFISYEEKKEAVEILLCGLNPKITQEGTCNYVCNCSRERMEAGLISIGKEEIQSIIDEQHEAELQCHFCNGKYHFSEDDLKALIK